jgi:hypothetical protein
MAYCYYSTRDDREMSKIKKKDLTRGVRLNKEHVWDDNLNAVITNLNSAQDGDGLIRPMYDKQHGTFRLTFNIPYFGSEWTENNGVDMPYIIPFLLLPLQEFVTMNATTSHLTPQVFLTEFTYGFDQRDEPALVTDHRCGAGTIATGGASNQTWSEYIRASNPAFINARTDMNHYVTNLNQGKLHYDIHDRGNLKFSILKKEALYFNTAASRKPTDSVYDLTVVMENFTGPARLNPHVEKDLDIEFDPYSTYCLGITPPQLADTSITGTRNNLALVNLTISLKFKHVLVNRDTTAAPENPMYIPSTGGLKANDNVAVTVPAAGSQIEAESADGLNTTTTTIDSAFRKGLNAGYDEWSNKPQVEQLTQDSCYDIIAIPMINCQRDNYMSLRDMQFGQSPYCYGLESSGGFPGNNVSKQYGSTYRAIVPINYPFQIHHVILAANCFTAPFYGDSAQFGLASQWWLNHHSDGQDPVPSDYQSGTCQDVRFRHHIGIGVGTGQQGSFYGYRQVLNYQNIDFSDANGTATLDNIRMGYPCTTASNAGGLNATLVTGATSHLSPSEWKLIYLPLNGAASQTAPGLYDQAFTKATTTTYLNIQDPPQFIGKRFVERNEAISQTNPNNIASYEGTAVAIDNPLLAQHTTVDDQWIEVRWHTNLENNAGFGVNWDLVGEAAAIPTTADDDGKIAAGYGGHWIYLIGKKQLVSNANWQDTDLKEGI